MIIFRAFQKIIAALMPLLVVVLVVFSAPAMAAVSSPGFTIGSLAEPTNFEVGRSGVYKVTVTNAGSIATGSGEVELRDELPAGLTAQGVEFFWSGVEGNIGGGLCATEPHAVACHFPVVLDPDETLTMIVPVRAEPSAPQEVVNRATVSGGGAAEESVAESNEVSSSPVAFGPSNFSFYISGSDGLEDTQAGDHPYELTTTIGLNNAQRGIGPEGVAADTSVQDLKDVVVDLPLGFVGSTLAAPECTLAQLSSEDNCPADTVV